MMHWLPLIALTLLQGCATNGYPPPLEAGWYFQTQREVPAYLPPCERGSQIEVILFNRSPQIIDVLDVVLNEYEPKSPPRGTGAWVWKNRFSLPPGGYKLLPTNCFERDAAWDKEMNDQSFSKLCVLPVSISVDVEPETRSGLQRIYGKLIGDDKSRVPVDMPGRMPSSLPENWRGCEAVKVKPR
jgi:hypothetical protein